MGNYEILKELIEKNAHALVLTGENRYEIYEKLYPLSKKVYVEDDFFAAVKRAFSLATECACLIFSPASTSFDAFRNFEERGESFKLALKDIKEV